MKKHLFTALLLLGFYGTEAQTGLYAKLRLLIQQKAPEMLLDNKLIAVHVWSCDNADSRIAGQSFEKAFEVYRAAKLKGGSKGLVVVGVSADNLNPEATIVLQKDGITRTIAVKSNELVDMAGIRNMVFDAYGNEVYRDLEPSQPYASIQKLITR